MIGLIIILILAFLLGWVLFAPIIIRIDTIDNVCEMAIPGVIRTQVSTDQSGLVIPVWLPVYRFEIRPFQSESEGPSKEKKQKSTKRKSKVPKQNQLRKVFNVLRSFRVTFFEAAIDTDDYALNAQLFPIAQFLRRRNIQASVNFSGNTYCRTEVRNSLWRLVTAFFGLKKY